MNTPQAHVGLICKGENHTVFLSNEGTAYIVGVAGQGLVLNSSEEEKYIPKRILYIPQIRAISCGLYSTICIDMEGNLWGFGENDYGQLGMGEKTEVTQPVKIPNLPPIKEVQCGIRHTLCISEDSSLWAFGSNGYSQLFVPKRPNVHKEIFPVKTEFSNIVSIMAGNACSFVQNMDGEILVCGYNGDGQLGLGIRSPVSTPTPILNQPPNIVAISCASTIALLLDEFGVVYAAGSGFSSFFEKIEDLPKIISISGGRNCKCVDEEGNLWISGKNYFDNTVNLKFTKSKHFSYVNHISCGTGHSDIIKDENGVFVCGVFTMGLPGIGNNKEQSTIMKWDDEFYNIVGSKMRTTAKSARK